MENHSSLPRPDAQPKPVSLLKALILHLSSSRHCRLYDDMVNAEREERCIRRALFLITVLLMLCLAGLGFLAILKPETTRDPNNPLTKIVLVLGLGSALSLAMFLGYLIWHRSAVKSLHTECLRSALALARDRLKEPTAPNPGSPAQNLPPAQGSNPDAPGVNVQG